MIKPLYILRKVRPVIDWVRNHKYTFVTIVFFLIILVLDDKNMIKHFNNQQVISELEDEIAAMKRDSAEIVRMQSQIDYRGDVKAIEDLAREKYGMQKDNEDVFIIE